MVIAAFFGSQVNLETILNQARYPPAARGEPRPAKWTGGPKPPGPLQYSLKQPIQLTRVTVKALWLPVPSLSV